MLRASWPHPDELVVVGEIDERHLNRRLLEATRGLSLQPQHARMLRGEHDIGFAHSTEVELAGECGADPGCHVTPMAGSRLYMDDG